MNNDYHRVDPADIPSAVAAAREAEIVIFAVGGHSAWFGGDVTEGESRDTANIDLLAKLIDFARLDLEPEARNLA